MLIGSVASQVAHVFMQLAARKAAQQCSAEGVGVVSCWCIEQDQQFYCLSLNFALVLQECGRSINMQAQSQCNGEKAHKHCLWTCLADHVHAWVLLQDEKHDAEASQGDIKLGIEPKGVGVPPQDAGHA